MTDDVSSAITSEADTIVMLKNKIKSIDKANMLPLVFNFIKTPLTKCKNKKQ